MVKRRRERDRPKSGPDAPYNPNKRVMLSYSSDDGQSEPDNDAGEPVAGSDAHLANYEIAPYPDETEDDENKSQDEGDDDDVYEPQLEQEAANEPPPITPDDKQEQSSNTTSNKPKRKERDRSKGALGGSAGVKRNLETNQWPALGSLSYQWEDGEEDADGDESDSTTADAMAYLRTVRAERQGIPAILAAAVSKADAAAATNYNGDGYADSVGEDDDGEDDGPEPHKEAEHGAHYSDGVYLADVRQAPTAEMPGARKIADPRDVFTKSLIARFMRTRAQLQQPASAEAVAALGGEHPTAFYHTDSRSDAQWLRLLSTVPPKPAQVRALDEHTVYGLLELIRTRLLRKGKHINSITSTWVFSLLARLQDVGTMTNDEVYPVRELGMHALFLQLSLRQPNMAAVLAAELKNSGAGKDVEERVGYNPDELGITSDLEATERDDVGGVQTTIANENALTANTEATLDMIIVIVGDVYGQRDMLEFRAPWTTTAAASVVQEEAAPA